MDLYWSCHVHAVMHGDDLVLLDAARNDYLVVPRVSGSVKLAHTGVGVSLSDRGLQGELYAAGLVVDEPPPGDAVREAAAPAQADLYDQPDPKLTAVQVARLAMLSAQVSMELHLSSLLRVVEPPKSADRGLEGEITEAALLLRAALPWLPFQGKCLYRAALLRKRLGLMAGRTRWVFGVSTWPFAAHCWVQLDGVVLNDRLQRVRRYTPILAV